jgi:hypothetical protein
VDGVVVFAGSVVGDEVEAKERADPSRGGGGFPRLLVTKNRKVRQRAHPSEDEGQLERLQQEPQEDDAE